MELKFLNNDENPLLKFFENRNVQLYLISLILKNTDTDNKILINQIELAKKLNVTVSSISKFLGVLIDCNIVKKVKNGVYMLNPDICVLLTDTEKSISDKKKIYKEL